MAKHDDASDLGLLWDVSFEFRRDDWFRDRGRTDVIVDAIAATAWWASLDVLGRDSRAGGARGDAADVKKAVAKGTGISILAHGPGRAALYIDETDAYVKIDVMERHLTLGFHARGDELRRLRGHAIDDVLDAIAAVRQAWGGEAGLARATATPTRPSRFDYSRPMPPQTANRPLDAVVDVVQAGFTPTGEANEAGTDAEDNRAIANAKTPREATRTQRDGLVIIRWVVDPSDPAAVRKAAAAHHTWIAPLVETTIEDGWNADGERAVDLAKPTQQPFPLWDRSEQTGYYVAPDDGKLTQARWDEIAAVAATRPVGVVMPSKKAALAAVDVARTAKVRRVVYRRGDEFWDPIGELR